MRYPTINGRTETLLTGDAGDGVRLRGASRAATSGSRTGVGVAVGFGARRSATLLAALDTPDVAMPPSRSPQFLC
jgi:hypothetical protein